jgi:stress response protein YsnF
MAVTPQTNTSPAQEHQLIAVFETLERARAANDRLVEEGAPRSDIRQLDSGEAAGTAGTRDEGVWDSIRRLFVPEEEAYGYQEGVRRGHVVLAIRVRPEDRERIVRTLEELQPIDFDTQLEQWRAEGWSPQRAATPAGWQPPTGAATAAERPGRAAATATEQTIPVVEEDVRVGKRVEDRGGVRVRSYVHERPIEQDVSLREERVGVERHPVDRPIGAADDAFRERTVEAKAYGEEPVVEKQARVVEEVGIRKDATERTERVKETARKTEVEVEDSRAKKP